MKKIYLAGAAWVLFISLVAGFTVAEIRDHGIKSIIESVWYGKGGKK